jgi:multidrug transporter EmrE-like cation transporter
VDPHNYQNIFALAGAIFLTAISQVLLRVGAKGKTSSKSAILSRSTLSGYLLFLIVILLMIFAMQRIPLRTVSAFHGITYILVPLAARIFVKDPLDVRMMFGAGTIVVGIVVFFI